jgi:AcrR family transcriptional regulator
MTIEGDEMQNAELTKENIKTAFWSLYEKKPLEKITVKEIIQAAGYSRNTFYYYFSDVYDVLEQLEEDILRQTDEAYLSVRQRFSPGQISPSVDDMVAVSEATFSLHNKYLPVLFGKYGDPQFHRKLRRHFIKYIRAYFPDYFRESSIETELMAEFFTSGFISALEFVGPNSKSITFREMIAILYRCLGISEEGTR